MRQGITPIDTEILSRVPERCGLVADHKTGWTKWYVPDANGKPSGKKSVGIPTTKQATRVELVGFEHPVGIRHPNPPAGTVTQMLDMSKPQRQVLQDLYLICKEGVLGLKPSREEVTGAAKDILAASDPEQAEGTPPLDPEQLGAQAPQENGGAEASGG